MGQRRQVRVGQELDHRIARRIEEALAAGDLGVVLRTVDLHRGGRQPDPDLAATIGQDQQRAVVMRERPVDAMAPAGPQLEAEAGVDRIEADHLDGIGHGGWQCRHAVRRRRPGQHRKHNEPGTPARRCRHGHQKALSWATPGSSGTSRGMVNTAMPDGGMPR